MPAQSGFHIEVYTYSGGGSYEETSIEPVHGTGALPDAAAHGGAGGGEHHRAEHPTDRTHPRPPGAEDSGPRGEHGNPQPAGGTFPGRTARRRRTAWGSVGACAPGGGSPGGERRGTGGECELRQHYGRLCRSEGERRHADAAGELQNTEYERTIRYFRQLHAGFEQLHADGTAVSEQNQHVLDRQGFRHRRKNPSYFRLVATVGRWRRCHHRERHPCNRKGYSTSTGFRSRGCLRHADDYRRVV